MKRQGLRSRVQAGRREDTLRCAFGKESGGERVDCEVSIFVFSGIARTSPTTSRMRHYIRGLRGRDGFAVRPISVRVALDEIRGRYTTVLGIVGVASLRSLGI